MPGRGKLLGLGTLRRRRRRLPGLDTLLRRRLPSDRAEVRWRKRGVIFPAIAPLVWRMLAGLSADYFRGGSGASVLFRLGIHSFVAILWVIVVCMV